MEQIYQKKNSKLYIQPDAGLGNRLYCLYSALYYAKKMNLDFDVIWLRETCCNVPFYTLFDKSFLADSSKIRTTYHLGYKNKYAIASLFGDMYMKMIKKRFKYYTAEDIREVFFAEGEEAMRNLIAEKRNKCIKANTRFFDTKNFGEVRELIKPSEEIMDAVDSIMKPYNNTKVYGVHIRRTDNKASIENSPIEVFYQILDELVTNDPTVKIYLATDDAEVESDFASRYNCVEHKTFSGEKSRKSIAGMMDAYVDMLCLSKCEKIYGSYGSSFSEMAAFIGNTELVIARK